MLLSLMLVTLLVQGQVVPDSLFVLKNGAEVRGRVVEIKDGRYTVDLADGRRMSYAVDEVESMRRLDEQPIPDTSVPESCGILVTEEKVPTNWYTPVKKVKWAKGWYGSNSVGFEKLAAEASKLGADAVVQAALSHGVTAFSWGSPKAEGLAIKWSVEGREKAGSIKGECFPVPSHK